MISLRPRRLRARPDGPRPAGRLPPPQRQRDRQHRDVLFELDPGAELAVHTDSAEELLIIVQGTAEARVGDEVGRLETHQVGLVPPMAPHGLRNIGEDVLRVLGTFSASTVVSTFERPFEEDGPNVVVIGSPVPIAGYVEEAVPA